MTPQEKVLLFWGAVTKLAWIVFICYSVGRVIRALDVIAAAISR